MKNKFAAMKNLLPVLLMIFCFTANATTYYFSASGNDANDGTSTSTPWKTLSKFNSVFASKSPGDNFLFNRGDVFYGKIIISRSGSSGLPITIGAYGTGVKPVITGFTSVSGWTSLGSNIWESTSAVSALPYTNMVTVNNVNTAMGRTPNTGSYTYQSHNAQLSITSSDLTGSPNWTGAELAFFMTTYQTARDVITSQSGGTLYYAKISTDVGLQADGKGFIIQNDPRTLDVQNEWYYNPSTKKIRIFTTTAPTGVELSTSDYLIYINGRSYITVDNISFKGANDAAIWMDAAQRIMITNCDFDMMGVDAIFAKNNAPAGFINIENCTINHCNNNGINFYYPATVNTTIRNSTVKNCGMIPFMGGNGKTGTGGATYGGIVCLGANSLIEYNRVDSVGYRGIYFFGSYSTVQNNYVSNFCTNLHDGGGIYTWNSGTGVTKQVKKY